MGEVERPHVFRDEEVGIEETELAEDAESAEDGAGHAGALADVWGAHDEQLAYSDPTSESIFGIATSPKIVRPRRRVRTTNAAISAETSRPAASSASVRPMPRCSATTP